MYKAIRYIGSKQNVLPFLEENLFSKINPGDLFFDGFVGSGIVSQYVAEKKPETIISGSDISLYSGILFNILNLYQYFNNEKKILDLIASIEKKPLISGNLFNELAQHGKPKGYSESRNFYHEQTGKTIDTFKVELKNLIQQKNISKEQANLLMFFLLAYCCKTANTTSVFAAYLKNDPKYIPFNSDFVKKILSQLKSLKELKNPATFYYGSIIENLKLIPKQNIIYLDPPYSTRRYESNYHVLNYIADLDFNPAIIKENSKTALPKNLLDNPFGKKKETEDIFTQMILLATEKSDLLGISYNTDGVIQQEWMEDFCNKNKLFLETKKLPYKRFKSKKENNNQNTLEEILWLIKKQ